MRHLRPWPVLLIAVLGVAAGPAPTERADLVIVNAHVWTVDDTRPEAEAVAVRGGRIALVGTSEEAQRLVGPGTRVVDAGGRLLLPGFQDGHTHFVSSGLEVGQLDLKDAARPEEFGRLIAEYAKRKRPGAWITGGNWDHEKWAGGPLPTAELIDRYVSDHPVFVTRYDGHMAVANTAALKAGNVTAQAEDPEGGSIVRRPGGREPAGVLKDAAMALVFKAIPDATPDEVAEGARKAFAEARRLGLTTVQDMLEGEAHLRAYETVRAEGGMTARIYGRWPVAPLDPILGIDAAVSRATLDGKNPEGWFPEQKVTVAEAVRAYTLENAYAAFMEAKTGSITAGKHADLVLLDQDLFRIPPGRIKETKVDMTVMGGKVVYERLPLR